MNKQKALLGIVWFAMVMLSTISCNAPKDAKTKESPSPQAVTAREELTDLEAAKLLTNVCYVCHNPQSGSHDEMLAPPLVGIKRQYQKATEDREAFITRMAAFVSNPNKENVIMKGPIRRFGLMPPTTLSDPEIKAIVTYIYDNDLPQPDWFEQHEEEMHGDGGE